MQDLERQLFDAKLDAMNAAKVDDSGSDSDSDGESEVPNASTLQELAETDEQKANFNDLKGANERIDQLEVEVFKFYFYFFVYRQLLIFLYSRFCSSLGKL